MKKGNKNAAMASKTDNMVSQTEADRGLEEKILKELEDSSSIISGSESMESDEGISETATEEGPDIFESLFQTDTESIEEEEEPEYIQRQSISVPQEDFFPVLEDVPSLENIRDDTPIDEVSVVTPIIPVISEYRKRDSGKFVSPLTGLEIKESLESMPSQSEDLPETKKSVYEAEETVMSDTSDNLYEEEAKKSSLNDDALRAFLQLQMEIEHDKDHKSDMAALARQEEAKNLEKFILKFLNDLIKRAVESAEHLGPEKFLKQNLDKRKLLLELVAKLQNLNYEQSQCTFLNRKVVHHFRRQKSFRSITEDSPKTLQREKQKLVESKIYLDQILSKEHTLMQQSEALQQELSQEYEILKHKAESQVQRFESKVKNHLYRATAAKLNADIDRWLVGMRKYRQEISAVRLSLLLKQHTAAKLNEMIRSMEELGNGLSMSSFTTLQAENQALGKKLEERNAELNKLNRRSHCALHTLTHYKENQKILYNTINIQRSILSNFMNERRALKEHLLSLKLQRNRIHKKMRSLSVQSGLLDKPALLYDYDNTAKLSEEKTEIVETLKNTLLMNQSKLDRLLKC